MEHNKCVLITGASRGIGKATAVAFAKTQRYRLILNCRHSSKELNALANALTRTYGIDCQPIVGDVSDSTDVERIFKQIESQFGGIDILINNAGISYVGLLSDLSYDAWNQILNTNLSSAFYCCKNAIPYMVHKKSGKILNVSSVWGLYGASCEAAYSATKGGINALTRALAKELAPSNIQVNAVAFGTIDTEMNDHLSPEEKDALAEEIPAGRFGYPDEAGEFIRSLAEESPYLTGQIVQFDGGWI